MKTVDYTLPALELIDQESVKNAFIDTASKMHGLKEHDAAALFEREARYYKRAVSESEKLKTATGLSLVASFLELAITGLSLQQGSKADCFLEPRNTKMLFAEKKGDSTVNVERWCQVCRLVVSAYGELNLRIKAGQIIRMNNPIVIYEGDHFQPKTNARGELTVDYLPKIKDRSKKIIGVWCSIVLPHNGIDFKWLLEDDIERLKNYSIPKAAANATYTPRANALYTANDGQIDPGFLEAKCIKHAMRAYTKLKISDNISFEDEPDEEESFATHDQVNSVQITQTQEEGEEETF